MRQLEIALFHYPMSSPNSCYGLSNLDTFGSNSKAWEGHTQPPHTSKHLMDMSRREIWSHLGGPSRAFHIFNYLCTRGSWNIHWGTYIELWYLYMVCSGAQACNHFASGMESLTRLHPTVLPWCHMRSSTIGRQGCSRQSVVTAALCHKRPLNSASRQMLLPRKSLSPVHGWLCVAPRRKRRVSSLDRQISWQTDRPESQIWPPGFCLPEQPCCTV